MSNLFDFFRDPLFGVVILIVIVAFISLSTYFWNIRTQKKQKDSLEYFIKLFENIEIDEVAKETLLKLGESLPALQFLADTYHRMGDYERSIKLYAAILECELDSQSRLATLQSLAEVYCCVGFLERAKRILLEVLKNNPRNPKALSLLMRTYESLGLFDEALDALSCLKELGLDTREVDLNYYYFLIKKSFKSNTFEQENIMAWLKKDDRLFGFIMEKLKIHNLDLFWSLCVSYKRGEEILDLLWSFKESELSFYAYEYDFLKEICMAKGYMESKQSCSIFELEVLHCVIQQKIGMQADLEFFYSCKECKQSYPLRFERCMNCGGLLSGELSYLVRKVKDENHLPFL